MDADGYPDEDELTRISEWHNDQFDWSGLMAFIRPLWRYAEDGYWKQQGSLYRLATGGWSGNEAIIAALRANPLFWGAAFISEVTGGLYWFYIGEDAMEGVNPLRARRDREALVSALCAVGFKDLRDEGGSGRGQGQGD